MNDKQQVFIISAPPPATRLPQKGHRFPIWGIPPGPGNNQPGGRFLLLREAPPLLGSTRSPNDSGKCAASGASLPRVRFLPFPHHALGLLKLLGSQLFCDSVLCIGGLLVFITRCPRSRQTEPEIRLHE